MNLNECLFTLNPCFKAGQKIPTKGIMLHSTGANNPNLRRYVQPDDGKLGKNTGANSWNRAAEAVCVHAFIGKLADGSVASYQTLPWNFKAWHCGVGTKGISANNTHLSIEICEDGLKDAAYFDAVYREAVELCAHLCKLHGFDPQKDGVLICHSEGYKRGIASNHADVMHWFPQHGKSMDTFRADVAAELKKEEMEMTKEEIIAIVNEVLDEREAARAAAPAADWDKAGEFDKAIQSGLTDGTRPESYPTRMETAVIAQRVLEKAAEIARAEE